MIGVDIVYALFSVPAVRINGRAFSDAFGVWGCAANRNKVAPSNALV